MMTLNPQKYVLEKGQLIAFRKEQKPLEPCGGSSSLFGRAVHKGEASLCTGENKALTAPASTKAVPPLTQTSSEEEAKGQREGSSAQKGTAQTHPQKVWNHRYPQKV